MTSFAVVSMSDKLMDCNGNEYSVVRMPGNGFCGFHSLSYALTGSHARYNDVIDDCIKVFANLPDLYQLRTDFAGRYSASLNDYQAFMEHAVQQVEEGGAVDSPGWADDGHFCAIALLYNIAIFMYSTQTNEWSVFNESGSCGYICLLNSREHFDVLHGINGPPVIPVAATTHAVDRHDLDNEAWRCLQRDYNFAFVHHFPEHFVGVRILNSPVVQLKPQTTPVVAASAAAVNELSGNSTQINDCNTIEASETGYKCDSCESPCTLR